ncbi:Uncharacterised protein [Mycobacteroides abscessus subsp. abscessus]|nr:Uncharacterised protein [Mycobacteroides abscessus subsp. abscessus]
MDNGNTAALMAKPTSSTAKIAIRVPEGIPSARSAISAIFRVPVAAYTKAMPRRKTTEDIIETITYEMPARTLSALAPMVNSTKLAASSTSNPT